MTQGRARDRSTARIPFAKLDGGNQPFTGGLTVAAGGLDLTGTLRATGSDNAFGSSAQSAAGTHVRLGSIGSTTDAFVLAAGSVASVGLVLSPKGTSSIALQSGDGQTVMKVSNPGSAGTLNAWAAGVVNIGYGAMGAANSYLSMGSESTAQVVVSALGTAADVNLKLQTKGAGSLYGVDGSGNITVALGPQSSGNSGIAVPDLKLGLGANGAAGGYWSVFTDASGFDVGWFARSQQASVNIALRVKGNGQYTLQDDAGNALFTVGGGNGTGNVTLGRTGVGGKLYFANVNSCWSGSATAGAQGAPPAQVRGYITVYMDQVGDVKIPVYAV